MGCKTKKIMKDYLIITGYFVLAIIFVACSIAPLLYSIVSPELTLTDVFSDTWWAYIISFIIAFAFCFEEGESM